MPQSRFEFFACNYWEDANQNGSAEVNEYVGIKNQFSANESITLIGIAHGQRESHLSIKVLNGTNKLVYSRNVILPFDNASSGYKFDPWVLYNLSGDGRYTVAWYLNDFHVGSNEFEINSFRRKLKTQRGSSEALMAEVLARGAWRCIRGGVSDDSSRGVPVCAALGARSGDGPRRRVGD